MKMAASPEGAKQTNEQAKTSFIKTCCETTGSYCALSGQRTLFGADSQGGALGWNLAALQAKMFLR